MPYVVLDDEFYNKRLGFWLTTRESHCNYKSLTHNFFCLLVMTIMYRGHLHFSIITLQIWKVIHPDYTRFDEEYKILFYTHKRKFTDKSNSYDKIA